MESIETRLKQFLSQREITHIMNDHRVPAAVLLPMYRKDGRLYLVFEKRTQNVSTHKGQIAFPGGAYSRSDQSLIYTALRESCEEIGLQPGDVQVLGQLDDNASNASNYTIIPFVGSIPYPYEFKLNYYEAERIIEVPIPELLVPGHMRQGIEVVDGKDIPTYFYHYKTDIIWGATARILHQLLDFLVRLEADDAEATRGA